MKYECIKECCAINFDDLSVKRNYILGMIYEFEHVPEKSLFKRCPGQRNKKKSK